MSEDQIQASFFKQAYNKYPQIRGLLFSIPNGSTRHILEAMKLKATGLTPGIPDMILLRPYAAYGIEFKSETGQLSQAQVKIHEVWRKAGITVMVFRSAVPALHWLDELMMSE